jgi:Amt family ammonium transporter
MPVSRRWSALVIGRRRGFERADGAAQHAARRGGRWHAVGRLVRVQRRQRTGGQWPAAMAVVTTHLGASAGALAWMLVEWRRYGKPSVLGVITGMVAGLGTITPASGFVGPTGALAIGFIAGVVCFFATQLLKRVLHIDDSLDVSPVHGVGGVVGTLLTGVFAATALGGAGFTMQPGIAAQLGVQALGVVAAILWCGGITWILLKLLDATLGLRVSEEQESEGLDLAAHGERGYSP